jgi:hypothetical protein
MNKINDARLREALEGMGQEYGERAERAGRLAAFF